MHAVQLRCVWDRLSDLRRARSRGALNSLSVMEGRAPASRRQFENHILPPRKEGPAKAGLLPGESHRNEGRGAGSSFVDTHVLTWPILTSRSTHRRVHGG